MQAGTIWEKKPISWGDLANSGHGYLKVRFLSQTHLPGPNYVPDTMPDLRNTNVNEKVSTLVKFMLKKMITPSHDNK